MSYLVLARKYRPQTFDDVVQQSHITKTLSHAITANRVAHALLFTGPRGTGKTTIARIVAKALNCVHGPTPTPCNQCPSCTEITNGNAADVFEIDGASNNSVDQIRELRENIPYLPSSSRYKIYIIDEVHMLSLAAFNALLKTLEEPPAHIIFLFATTDPHKIPITILSRCQRHDMRRINTQAISEHLALLCRKEGFELPAEVLTMVAREAGGSMRDALSLLDQILSCSDGTVHFDQILNLFGVVDRKVVFDLAAAILNGNMAAILDILADSYGRGQDLKRLYLEVIEHFRNILVVKLGHNVENLVDLPLQEIEYLKNQGANISPAALSQLFDFLFKEEQNIRLATQPKLALEMVFFRMIRMRPALSIDELIFQLEALRSGLSTEPLGRPPKSDDNSIVPKKQVIIEESAVAADSIDDRKTLQPISRPQPKDPITRPVSTSSVQSSSPDAQSFSTNDLRSTKENKTDAAITPIEAESDIAPLLQGEDLWDRLVSLIRNKKPSLGSILSNCRLLEIKNDCLNVEIDDNGYAVSLIKKNLPQLEQWCQQLAGRPMRLNPVAGDSQRNGKLEKKKQTEHLKSEALSHPIVLDALEVFNGKVSEVKIL